MAKLLTLDNCLNCPYLTRTRHYTGDSFEIVFSWYCSNRPKPEFIGYEEDGELFPNIPKFCSLPTLQ